MAEKQRPAGVAVLAILVALAGILCFIFAAVIGILSTAMEEFLRSMIKQYGGRPIAGIEDIIAAVMLAMAVVAAIFGILALIDAYGLWTGKGWAWWLTIILSILGIIGGILSLPWGIIGIVIDILIIYYFTRPHVKEFFGLAAPKPPPPPPP